MSASTAHKATCLLHAVLGVALWFGVLVQDTSAADGEVVARVNGEAITLSELAQFEAEGRTSEDLDDRVAARARLERAIDARLLVQAAVRTGLKNDSSVRIAIENARRRTLVQAHLSRLLVSVPPPTDAEVTAHIREHPHHFAGRFTYHYRIIELNGAPTALLEELGAGMRLHSSPALVAAWLRGRGFDARVHSRWDGSERLEPALLQALQQTPAGEMHLVREPGADLIALVQPQAAYPDPVHEERVRPALIRGLHAVQRDRVLRNHLAALRANAVIVRADEEVSPALAGRGVVLTVDGAPILAAELAAELGVRNRSWRDEAAREQVLEAMVEERLLEGDARRAGVAEDARIIAAMEAAERAALVEAHVKRLPVPALALAHAAAKAYVEGNPGLFSMRQVFRFRELVLRLNAGESVDSVRREIEVRLAHEDLATWLDAHPGALVRNALWRPADEIVPASLQVLRELRDGEARVIGLDDGKSVMVLYRLSAHADPLAEEEAVERVAGRMRLQMRAQAVAEEVERLRRGARITYEEGWSPAEARAGVLAHWPALPAGLATRYLSWVGQSMVLALVPMALVWLVRRSRERVEFVLAIHVEPTWSQRLADGLHSNLLLGLAATAVVAGVGLMTLALWLGVREVLPQERMVAGGVLGGALALVVGAVPWLLTKGRAAGTPFNRWWPLAMVLTLQGLIAGWLWWGRA